jgi:cytochrome c peroxidase
VEEGEPNDLRRKDLMKVPFLNLHTARPALAIFWGIYLIPVFAPAAGAQSLPNLFPFPNQTGIAATYNANGAPIDLTGPFFQSLGTNGRSCSSCHRPSQGWSISAAGMQALFALIQGLDPVFRPVDGSNCDHNIDISTLAERRQAYSLLINRGLIRIALAVPANAEFTVVNVANPYGCSDPTTLSMYRRPLPATNLRFLSAVMWDAR